MPEGGKWCFPCGYLDWDETLEEAASRELYEETGLFVPAEEMKQWFLFSTPSSQKQNVVVWFHAYLDSEPSDEEINIDNQEVVDYSIIQMV